VSGIFTRRIDPDQVSLMSTGKLRSLLEDCGFKVVVQEVSGFSFLYPLLSFFLYRPGRLVKHLLEATSGDSAPVESLRSGFDHRTASVLGRWRRSFLGLGVSQLVVARRS
jgi:hypothetical protein